MHILYIKDSNQLCHKRKENYHLYIEKYWMIVLQTTTITLILWVHTLLLWSVESSFEINSPVELPIFSNGNNNSGVLRHTSPGSGNSAAINKQASSCSCWWLIKEVTAPINAINDQSQNWTISFSSSCENHYEMRSSPITTIPLTKLTSNNHALNLSWYNPLISVI